MNYWGYRIDVNHRDFFFKEIKEGRLRQGWGSYKNQDLRLGAGTDISARRNFPIFNKVKKGDILLVPRVETWDEIAIVEAIEDFDDPNNGYHFEIDEKLEDYGHIFPVEFKRCFSRHNINVDGAIRETLKCRSRFWNINRCESEINKILSADPSEVKNASDSEERFRNRVENAFDEDSFSERLYNELKKDAQASEWEFLLCEGFRRLFPDKYIIEPTSNRIEKEHGADIIIKIPGILNMSYLIAIQVKDYTGIVSNEVVDQICKADGYFGEDEEIAFVDKYVILTKAESKNNTKLIEYAEEYKVKVLFDSDVKKLLSDMARGFIGDGVLY